VLRRSNEMTYGRHRRLAPSQPLEHEKDRKHGQQAHHPRACEEAVATITSLVPRLEVARSARLAPLRVSACRNCDDKPVVKSQRLH
jgi:hypothetical protein